MSAEAKAAGPGALKVIIGLIVVAVAFVVQKVSGIDLLGNKNADPGQSPPAQEAPVDPAPRKTPPSKTPEPVSQNPAQENPAPQNPAPTQPKSPAEEDWSGQHPKNPNQRFVKGARQIELLHKSGTSDVWVECSGTVDRLLADDNNNSDGTSRHQKFIVDIGRGLTILISHNIDLAQRVPVKRGDEIRFQGEYEFHEKGGVVHWTHHNPIKRNARKPGGWLDHKGKRYE